MTSLDRLQDAVQQALDSVRKSIEGLTSMDSSDGIFPIYTRAILGRQFESLDTIVYLVRSGQGHAAPPLLRPSCEEYIWLTYLNSLPPESVKQILTCVTELEKAKLVSHQLKYEEVTGTEFLAPSLSKPAIKKDSKSRRQELKDFSTELEWEVVSDELPLPKVWWMAEATDLSDFYNFIYEGTSRFVHFSCLEILRRTQDVGTDGEKVKVGSDAFREHWAAFALYWGLDLFQSTVSEARNTKGLSLSWTSETKWQSTVALLESHGKVPLIYGEEVDDWGKVT